MTSGASGWISGDEEECVLVNAREMAPLWSVLADWTGSEDEAEWAVAAPAFAEIIRRWDKAGYVHVYCGGEWPAHEGGERVTGEALEALLRNPSTWEYREHPPVVGLLVSEAAPYFEPYDTR
ncbi:hypothetical protein [Streptomyces albireticuli]|uniref:Uncharacterized protein n=1 Tax=Streptomyces albireticuli TaxID=1940 RepID=A0A2A2D0X1_9ACTN|nr:hypothetical protein [Streptomyces albireticuli]MCD9141800.1 hypothetical protein [Streptomyces albireticuli]MCD9163256.1 hypothetical protein [Streptomyces albireticuli]MCD9189974.1 hypothetical protein [Streptomyces albireticuli]PAU45066.1 hypothetical protein CK936_31505 [Streptomyces albireticuli]